MRRKAFIGALALAATILVSAPAQVFAAEGYTYNYDWFGDVQYSPDAYEVVGVFDFKKLDLDKKLNKPQSMFVIGNMIYLADTGNNRIIEIERTSKDTVEVKRIIDHVNGIDNGMFVNPMDVAVSEEGDIFVADQGNGRVIQMDKDLNFVQTFTKPTDPNFDQSLDFMPNKICIDTAGRVYCIATNVNKGLIKFENDGEFSGFVGATKVTFDFADYIWKKFATKAQREQMESFVPTEYTNIYMDYEGFIYACTDNVAVADLRDGSAEPVRRLNMMGNDILIRNGDWYIIGDVDWGKAGGYEGPSLINDITAMDNDIYFALDRVRGKVFAYNDQGQIVYAFGGPGNIEGNFRQPIALEHMGHDILVLDALDNSFTLFTPTEYGNKIFEAVESFKAGEYDKSGAAWNAVMAMNGNSDLAYIGIGRALLGQKKYEEALPYFKTKYDTDNYSKAYKQYRKIWVEEHIGIIFLIIFLIMVVPMIVNRLKVIKWQIETSDAFKYQNNVSDEKKKK